MPNIYSLLLGLVSYLCSLVYYKSSPAIYVSRTEQFHRSYELGWTNTSIIFNSNDFHGDENLLVNSLQLYPKEELLLLASIVGYDTLVDALELDERTSRVLRNAYGLVSSPKLYDNSTCANMENWLPWMGCCIQTFWPNTTRYKAAVSENVYGKENTPDLYKKSWSLAGLEWLTQASGTLAAAQVFKNGQQKMSCVSQWVVVDNMFNIFNGTDDDPAFLLGVIPRSTNGQNCMTKTTANEIALEIAKLIDFAMARNMIAFCLTVTGKPGWFGSNNWYGTIKVFPTKGAGRIKYSSMPCLNLTKI